MQFTKDMSIQDALLAHPRAREIFERHGMECLDCLGSTMESIEAGASMHDVNIDTIIAELNKLLEEVRNGTK